MDGPPSAKQWDRIIARVAEVDGKPVTHAVYVDRYWPRSPYNDMYWPWQRYAQCSGGGRQYTLQNAGMNAVAEGMLQQANVANQMGQNVANQMAAADFVSHAQGLNDFDGEAAMRALGRKDRNDIN